MDSELGWKNWTRMVVSETKRFGEQIVELQKEIKEHNKELSGIQKEITKLNILNNTIQHTKDLDKLEHNLEKIEDDIEKKLNLINIKYEKMEEKINELEKFNVKIATGTGISLTIVTIGISILAILV